MPGAADGELTGHLDAFNNVLGEVCAVSGPYP